MDATSRPRVRPTAVLVALSLGLFMTLLDTTIVNIAVPSLVANLGAGLDQVLWVMNAYVLALAVLMITAGRLGDLFGPRTLYLAGLALFTAASALCGLAHDPNQLIAGRALQGVGAALLTPQPIALLMTLLPPDRRGSAFAVTGIVAGVAGLCGPTLGGLIVGHLGWRWIFYVNVPVGVAALLFTVLVVPDLRPGRRHRLDLLGVALATLGLVGIAFGLIEGQRYDWGSIQGPITIPLVIAAGAALLAAFLAVQAARQRGDREPLVPFVLFRDRNYALMNVVGAGLQFAMLGFMLPFTIYLQSVLGLSALDAGLVMIPANVVSMLASPFVGRLVDRVGGKFILLTGLLLFGAWLGVWSALAGPDTNPWVFVPTGLLGGVGMSCIFAPMFQIATRELAPHLAGAASGVINSTRQLGGVIGGAAIGALLQNRLAGAMQDQATRQAALLPASVRGSFVAAFGQLARRGLDLTAGQGGAAFHLPPGLPAAVARQVQQLAHEVFARGFVDGMRETMLLPIAVLLAAALFSLAVRARSSRRPHPAPTTEEAPTAAAVH